MNFDPTLIFESFFGNTSAFTVVMWIVGATIISVFVRKSWPAIRSFVNTVDALGGLPEALVKLEAMSESLKVLDELRPNHGGSIRDHVTKISSQTASTSRVLKEHIELCRLAESVARRDMKKITEPSNVDD